MGLTAIIFLSLIGGIIFLLLGFYALLKYKEHELFKKENSIKKLFLDRTALIPSVFEISKDHINKHDQIFKEILRLRTRELGEDSRYNSLYKIIPTKKLIQHEISFIFKVCNRHPLLIKEGKFIYLRKLILEKSGKISKEISIYKDDVDKFNRLRHLKNLSIIGYLLPLREKVEL